MTWEISPAGESCRLVVTSDDFDGETATYRSFVGGMPVIVSGLKTLLETEQPLRSASSRRPGYPPAMDPTVTSPEEARLRPAAPALRLGRRRAQPTRTA